MNTLVRVLSRTRAHQFLALLYTFKTIFVRFRVRMCGLSLVQSCLCPDNRAFKVAYVQTSMHSNFSMSKQSCLQGCLCPDCHAFKVAFVQTIVRSMLPMSRLSCVQICLSPDYRAFIRASRPCNFERTSTPLVLLCVHFNLKISIFGVGTQTVTVTVTVTFRRKYDLFKKYLGRIQLQKLGFSKIC